MDGRGAPLVLAHGFTQTANSWGPFGEALARRHRLVRVNLPGHGGSAAVRSDLWRAGALVLDAGDRARSGDAPVSGEEEPVDLLGYSLGARVALHAAIGEPARVRRLVLLSATAGIEDDVTRTRRRESDEALATELERSGDVEGFVRRWLAGPLFRDLPAVVAGVEERLANTAQGLASSLRTMGSGMQEPLWSQLGALEVPVLVVTGAADPRYCALGARIAGQLPHATLSVVPGATHAVHLHQPAQAARIVEAFLAVGV